jgi:hypothetical protein
MRKLQTISIDHHHQEEAFKQSKLLAVLRVIVQNIGYRDWEFFSHIIHLCHTTNTHNFELVRKELGHLIASVYRSILSTTFSESTQEANLRVTIVFEEIRTRLLQLPEQNSKNAADTGKFDLSDHHEDILSKTNTMASPILTLFPYIFIDVLSSLGCLDNAQ